MLQEGSWLAADGSYQNYVNSICGSDPRLRRRDPKSHSQKTPWLYAESRVVSLELGADNQFVEPVEFESSTSLEAYLATDGAPETSQEQSGNADASGQQPHKTRRRVLILEGMNPQYIAVLGHHFSLHPSFFVEHERIVVMSKKAEGESDGFPLPSVARGRDHLVLKYYEPMAFNEAPSSFRLVCASTGRHIGVSRDYGQFSDVCIVRRKCTILYNTRHGGDSWDCLVLTDPPVTQVRTGFEYKDVYDVMTRPYQGGYVDFMPHKHGVRGSAGPPRTSLLNDLVYYLRSESNQVDLSRPETSVGVFVNKIVASHYLKHSEHLRATLSYVQRGLSRKQDLTTFTMGQVEDLWSDIQAWERRTGEYCEDLEAIMLQLGIQLETPNLRSSSRPSLDWTDSTVDYQFLLMRFRDLRHRTECLNSAITGLANIAGNRQAFKEQQLAVQEAKRSIREAKSTKAVTLLGLVFIPLAYTSSLFSMSDPFRPGDVNFWIYWASSIPLIVVVMTGYYVLDWGYTDDGAAWSPQTFWKSVQVRMGLKKGAGSFFLEEPKAGG